MNLGVRKKGSWPALHFAGWKKLEPFLGSLHKALLCAAVSQLDGVRKEHQYSLPGGGRDTCPSLPGIGLPGIRFLSTP